MNLEKSLNNYLGGETLRIQDKVFKEKLDEFALKEQINLQQCPFCGKNSLVWSTVVFEMREYQGGNLVIGGNSKIFPLITATCSKCGNVVFFNAITLGLIDPKTGKVIGSDNNEQKEKKE